jgi:hypothetical protein
MCPGSGGWSFPKPNNKAVIDTLPPIQLYNLRKDPGEKNNLQAEKPQIVKELKDLLIKQILDGRSTPGPEQPNDPSEKEWKQIGFTK